MRVITLARKPLAESNVAANVLKYGAGAINVDATRVVGTVPSVTGQGFRTGKYGGQIGHGDTTLSGIPWIPAAGGRWPANVVLEHLPECRCVGSVEVKNASGPASGPTLTGPSTSNSRGRFEGVQATAYPGKIETVAAWECAPGCPVAELDRQAGPLQSGTGAVKRNTSAEREGNTGFAFGAESRPEGTPMVSYGDAGGASRFFKQVGGRK